MSAPYTPPPVPDEDGYYWAYLVWELNMGEFRTIIEVRHGRLFALTLTPLETPGYAEVIPHDVLRWGERLEFPKVKG